MKLRDTLETNYALRSDGTYGHLVAKRINTWTADIRNIVTSSTVLIALYRNKTRPGVKILVGHCHQENLFSTLHATASS